MANRMLLNNIRLVYLYRLCCCVWWSDGHQRKKNNESTCSHISRWVWKFVLTNVAFVFRDIRNSKIYTLHAFANRGTHSQHCGKKMYTIFARAGFARESKWSMMMRFMCVYNIYRNCMCGVCARLWGGLSSSSWPLTRVVSFVFARWNFLDLPSGRGPHEYVTWERACFIWGCECMTQHYRHFEHDTHTHSQRHRDWVRTAGPVAIKAHAAHSDLTTRDALLRIWPRMTLTNCARVRRWCRCASYGFRGHDGRVIVLHFDASQNWQSRRMWSTSIVRTRTGCGHNVENGVNIKEEASINACNIERAQ